MYDVEKSIKCLLSQFYFSAFGSKSKSSFSPLNTKTTFLFYRLFYSTFLQVTANNAKALSMKRKKFLVRDVKLSRRNRSTKKKLTFVKDNFEILYMEHCNIGEVMENENNGKIRIILQISFPVSNQIHHRIPSSDFYGTFSSFNHSLYFFSLIHLLLSYSIQPNIGTDGGKELCHFMIQ